MSLDNQGIREQNWIAKHGTPPVVIDVAVSEANAWTSRIDLTTGVLGTLPVTSGGTGIIAGGAMRPVFEVLGVQDVLAKIFGSRNAMNVVRATIKGLTQITSPEQIANKRGKTVKELMGSKYGE